MEMEMEMEMETKEVSAKTVEEAIEVALIELDARRGEVEVNIISRGKTGFLGLGSELARVRVRKLPASASMAALAMGVLNHIQKTIGTSTMATLRNAHDPEAGGPVIDIEGDDSGLLIGRRGETLRALQFLVNLMVNRDSTDKVRVLIDVEEYRARREGTLHEMALRVASRVAATGRSVSLEPMPAGERRVIHMALADHPQVTTESSGFGNTRKVTIAAGKGGGGEEPLP